LQDGFLLLAVWGFQQGFSEQVFGDLFETVVCDADAGGGLLRIVVKAEDWFGEEVLWYV